MIFIFESILFENDKDKINNYLNNFFKINIQEQI